MITLRKLPILPKETITFTPPKPPAPTRHKDGLTEYNSVTISHSSISGALPAGRYHYSLFDGIDVFQHNHGELMETYQETIEKLEKDVRENNWENNISREQLDFATDVIEQIIAELSSLNADDKLSNKALLSIKAIVGDSLLEM